AECKVIGYTEGKGKFQGKIGALLCQMPNDRVIRIGSGLKDKDNTVNLDITLNGVNIQNANIRSLDEAIAYINTFTAPTDTR
ncbi:hypothetical protein VWM75_09100, partial [Campylobacter coli]